MFDGNTYTLKGSGMNATLVNDDGMTLSVDYGLTQIAEAAAEEVSEGEFELDIIDEQSGEVRYRAVFTTSGSPVLNTAEVEVAILDVDSGDIVLSARTSTEGYASVGIHKDGGKIGVVTNHRLFGMLIGQSRLPMGLSMYNPDKVGEDNHRISWSEGSVKEKLFDNVEKIHVSQTFADKEVGVLGLLAASMALQANSSLNQGPS